MYDGTGAPALRADIGITAGRIAALGALHNAAAGAVIDATGRYVLPGFVDAHSHADAAVLDPAVMRASLRQGVTTLVLGQDGLSYAPSSAAALAFAQRYFAAINGAHPDLDPAGVSVAQLRATWHHRTALNTAYLVPHGTVRYAAMGGAQRPADADELVAMREAVERGLADGAVGLSSGLEYVPGRYGNAAELAQLCQPVAQAGLPYVTHMRGYGANAPTGAAEARDIGIAAGVAVHISHYHGPGPVLASIVDSYRAGGLDLTFDTYPYRRSCTILAMAALPRWLDDTDLDRVVATLGEPAVRQTVTEGLNPDLLSRITLAHVPAPQWSWAEGLALSAVAERVDRPAAAVLLDLLVDTGLSASAVIAQPATTDEEALRLLLRHPCHVGGLRWHLRRRAPAPARLGHIRQVSEPPRARPRRLVLVGGGGAPRRPPGPPVRAYRPGRAPARPRRRPRGRGSGTGRGPGHVRTAANAGGGRRRRGRQWCRRTPRR